MRVTGFQATVAWQASQAVVALMCRAPTPVALVPSWQVAQRSVTPAWSKRAGRQAEVAWQVSQVSGLGMCFEPRPVARVPSWHEAQLPITCV